MSEVIFQTYSPDSRNICLLIFDENCPKYFAPNERLDYKRFLDGEPTGYEVCISNDSVVGAYGLVGDSSTRRSLNWILLSPRAQGMGLGSIIMERVIELAHQQKLSVIDISASHLSKSFFAKFGAGVITEKADGWGPGMHRVDMELKLKQANKYNA